MIRKVLVLCVLGAYFAVVLAQTTNSTTETPESTANTTTMTDMTTPGSNQTGGVPPMGGSSCGALAIFAVSALIALLH